MEANTFYKKLQGEVNSDEFYKEYQNKKYLYTDDSTFSGKSAWKWCGCHNHSD